MKITGIATTIILACTIAVAHAEDWQHARLQSAEGISITLDYKKAHIEDSKHDSRGVLSPLWINVSGLKPSDTVTARLMNFDIRRLNWVESRDVTLRYEDGRFTTEIRDMPYYRFHCGAPVYSDYNQKWYCQRGSDTLYEYRQELNIQINGQYLVDPVSGSHNFQLDL